MEIEASIFVVTDSAGNSDKYVAFSELDAIESHKQMKIYKGQIKASKAGDISGIFGFPIHNGYTVKGCTDVNYDADLSNGVFDFCTGHQKLPL